MNVDQRNFHDEWDLRSDGSANVEDVGSIDLDENLESRRRLCKTNVVNDRLNSEEKEMNSNSLSLRKIFVCGDERNYCHSDQVKSIASIIRRDLHAADLRCCLYMIACNSYRHTTCLHPYPPGFLHENCALYKEIVNLNQTVPPLRQVLQNVQDQSKVHTLEGYVGLLHWLLVDLDNPYLISVPKSEHSNIFKLVSDSIEGEQPDMIFKLEYCPGSVKDIQWSRLKQSHGTKYAFHGSKIENFHSIVYYGLYHHLGNKEQLYGPGIYLSNKLGVSLMFSPYGLNWTNSCLGDSLSVVALVEYVNHPSILKHPKEVKYRDQSSLILNNEVPKHYIVIPNVEYVKVRYLLVYKLHNCFSNNTGTRSWLRSNTFVICLLNIALFVFMCSHNFDIIKNYFMGLHNWYLELHNLLHGWLE